MSAIGCKTGHPLGCMPHGRHYVDRFMSPISEEEMQLGYRHGRPIGWWQFHNADGTFTSVRCDTDEGDVDDSWRTIHRLTESHIITQPDGWGGDGPIYRAESEPDPDYNGELRTVQREQLWPYVPHEVDVEAEVARLRVFEKRPPLVGGYTTATVTVTINGRDVSFRDVARPDGFYDIAWARQEFRADEIADAPKLTTGVYGGGGFTWASDSIVITTAHAESQLPDCLLPAPDYLAMCAKRPGWYAMTGHEYRLWGPPTAKHLRTLSPKTIKRKVRRARRQGRHIHACDVAMEETRQPRAELAARRAAASAHARWERKKRNLTRRAIEPEE